MYGFGFQVVNDRFQLIAELAQGRMSTVFKGRDIHLNREVAIKFLHPDLAKETEWYERFKREAKILCGLQHPHLVQIFSFGKDERDNAFIVTELVDGLPLSSIITREARIDWKRAASIAAQICDVMSFVHEAEIAHRDLKPSNILVMNIPQDYVKVIDFGLGSVPPIETVGPDFAKGSHIANSRSDLTMTGQLIGTPGYMPPELLQGKADPGKGDIYSLGCILYEMITGRMLFEADSPTSLLYKHATEKLPNLADAVPEKLPARLQEIVATSLAKNPADRFQSMCEFRTALEDCLERPEQFPLLERSRRMNPVARSIMVGAIAIVALLPLVLLRTERTTLVFDLVAGVLPPAQRHELVNSTMNQLLETGRVGEAYKRYLRYAAHDAASMTNATLELKLAQAMAAQGNTTKAVQLCEKAATDSLSLYPSSDPRAIADLICACFDVFRQAHYLPSREFFSKLGQTMILDPKSSGADQLWIKQYTLCKEILGENDSGTVSALKNISQSLEFIGRHDEALTWVKKYLAACDELSMPEALQIEGDIYMSLGEKQLARKDYEQCVLLCEKQKSHRAIVLNRYQEVTPFRLCYLTSLAQVCLLELDSRHDRRTITSLIDEIASVPWNSNTGVSPLLPKVRNKLPENYSVERGRLDSVMARYK